MKPTHINGQPINPITPAPGDADITKGPDISDQLMHFETRDEASEYLKTQGWVSRGTILDAEMFTHPDYPGQVRHPSLAGDHFVIRTLAK
jgi:hypothetical protein